MEIAVVLQRRHLRAQQRACRFQCGAGGQRRVEVAALRGGQQFDADHVGRVLGHRQQAACAVRGHRHVVFLVGRGRDRIDAGRVGALLVLRHQRRGGDLRDHEAGIEPWLRGQERWQPGQRRIHQHGHAALADRTDLADRQRQHVGGEGHRLGVEVAAGQRLAGVAEHQRIVGHAVGLDRQRGRGLAHHVQRRAHHLRLAAQAVRILHAHIVVAVRIADRRAVHQFAQRSGGGDLPVLAAQGVDARIERGVRALGRFGGQRAGDQRGMEHALDLEQPGQRVGGGKLGAVEQRQAFLGAQRQRLQAGLRQRLRGRQALAADEGFADADHHRGQMRQRRQIAGRADRALARHHRHHVVLQQRFQQRERSRTHAGGPLCQAGQLQRQHQPHHRHRHRLADPGRMRQHDIALQGVQVLALDTHAGQLAEAGVDAVHRRALGDDRLHRLRAAQHRFGAGRIQAHAGAAVHGAPLCQAHCARAQHDLVAHCPLQMRACSGLKPMR